MSAAGVVWVSDSNLARNSAGFGGAVFVGRRAQAHFYTSTFDDNIADSKVRHGPPLRRECGGLESRNVVSLVIGGLSLLPA